MAIDRVSPSSATLTLAERQLRERPGTTHTVPPVARPQDGAGQFAPDAGLPGAVGALLEAMNGRATGSSAATLAGQLAAAEAALGDTMSMLPNQVFLSRQLVGHSPEPSAMAAAWMAMVRTYAEQREALRQQADGRRLPASLFQSDQVPAALRDGRAATPSLVTELDAWRFAVYAWGGEKLVLRIVTRDDEDEDAPSGQRREPALALRLEVHLPDLGKVMLQVAPGDGGALLEIGAAQGGAMARMRELLPEIGAIATRCGMRIGRVRLARQLAPVGTIQPTGTQVALLAPALFRTMAEVAVLLSQPRPAGAALAGPGGT